LWRCFVVHFLLASFQCCVPVHIKAISWLTIALGPTYPCPSSCLTYSALILPVAINKKTCFADDVLAHVASVWSHSSCLVYPVLVKDCVILLLVKFATLLLYLHSIIVKKCAECSTSYAAPDINLDVLKNSNSLVSENNEGFSQSINQSINQSNYFHKSFINKRSQGGNRHSPNKTKLIQWKTNTVE
jgi:hypothetical protein